MWLGPRLSVHTYGRCPSKGGVCLREVSTPTGGVRTYGRCPHLREVSTPTGGVHTYGRCPHLREVSAPTGGVHLRKVSVYGRCPHLREVSTPTGGVRLREVSMSGISAALRAMYSFLGALLQSFRRCSLLFLIAIQFTFVAVTIGGSLFLGVATFGDYQ